MSPQEGDTFIHPEEVNGIKRMFYYTNGKWIDITEKDPYDPSPQFPKKELWTESSTTKQSDKP